LVTKRVEEPKRSAPPTLQGAARRFAGPAQSGQRVRVDPGEPASAGRGGRWAGAAYVGQRARRAAARRTLRAASSHGASQPL